MQSESQNPLLATFQLSSAASLNLGRSPNGVLGNGLTQSELQFWKTLGIKKKNVFKMISEHGTLC